MRTQKHNRTDERDEFRKKVDSWAVRLRVKPKQVRIQRMTRKWASWSTSGRGTFATDLLRKPAIFMDYVIVHELLHFRVPNHGKLFKSLLTTYIPGWRNLAARLVPSMCLAECGRPRPQQVPDAPAC